MGKTTKFIPLIFIFIWFIFCLPFFGKGLIPAPLDFLTGFYGPWQAYQSLPIKNPAIPDVVSQIIPWKIFTIETLKNAVLPLWNPYNFSGSPHLENYQSSVFSVFNFLFFILPFVKAWSLFILLQPLFAGLFTYLFCRKIKISPFSSLISALSFAFGGFMAVWLEYGTLGWALVWLPLVLYSLESYWSNKKIIYQILITLGLSASFLSGHIQISLYVFGFSVLYCLWQFYKKRIDKNIFLVSIIFIFLTLPLVAVQLLPTLGYYLQSSRSQQVPQGWFKSFQIPFYFLITFIFPNFFGNPVTRNFQVNASYVEMMGYIGLMPMVIIFAYILFAKLSKAVFFLLVIIGSLLLALPTPLSNALMILKVPVLSSSSPARIICIICFSLAIMAGFAIDYLIENVSTKNKKILSFFFGALVLFLLVCGYGFVFNKIIFRNILLTLGLYLLFLISLLLIMIIKFKQKKLILSLVIAILVSADLFYFWNKFNPFTKVRNFYPSTKIINFLKQNSGDHRVYGLLDDNLNLAFNIQTTSGYDSLNIINYQELLSASRDGKIALSDRVTGEKIQIKGRFSKKLLDLLSVKYVVSGKSDLYSFPTWEYPDSFKLAWEDSQYRIYENLTLLPRYFLTQDYKIVSSEEFLNKTLDEKDLKTIILTNVVSFKTNKISNSGKVELAKFNNNEKEFNIKTNSDSLLFLSDTYLSGWQAFLDNKKINILKANYAFGAVQIPAGSHKVRFIYKPATFVIGSYLTIITIFGLLFWYIFGKLRPVKL